MRQIWRIARREVKAYYDHPTAYILVIAFLLVALYVAFRTLYGSGAASLRTVFLLLPWMFAIFIPAMTMRAFAEERRSGTLEWLAAQPITELELLLGKYLGNLLFALTTLIGTLPTAIGLMIASEADPGIFVAQYLGGLLLAMQMTAIGIWASSATKNQVTAFILGLAVSWSLVFAGENLLLTNLPPAVANFVGGISILGHFESVARGVIDFRDALYFITTAVLFLAFAYAVLARERLSPVRGAVRRLRAVLAVIVVAVVVVNFLSTGLRQRLDLTSKRLYTLADASEQVLRGLEKPVTIKLFVSQALPPEVQRTVRDVRDLLGDLRSASRGKVRIEELKPDGDKEAEGQAVSYGLRPLQFSILRGDEFQVKRGWFGIVVLYDDRRQSLPVVQRTEDLEYRLVSTIAGLSSPKRSRITFLTGFGARTPFSYNLWHEALQNRYTVGSIFADTGSTPVIARDSVDVLVVAGPRRQVDSSVVRKIKAYVDAGGPALLLIDETDVGVSGVAEPVKTGLESMVAERGIKLLPGIVFDLKSNERTMLGARDGRPYAAPFPLWPRVIRAADHPITAGLSTLTLGWPGAIEIADTTAVRPLWTTTEVGGRYPANGVPVQPEHPFYPDTGHLGRQTVAAAVPGKPNGPGRLVVVSDADFVEDQFAKSNPQNGVFATNAIDWLLQDERLIAIRSKDRSPPPLVFDTPLKRDLLKWGNIFGVPILVGLIGAFRVIKRRRSGNRRWSGRVD
ncbi:MAG: Gldg family protein [Gemmatimonadota bacterium]